MRFAFNPQKAAQAAAYLVHLNDGNMEVFWLVKLLYLSDRKALTERGLTITGDELGNMDHGPVVSRIYDQTKLPEDVSLPWYQHFEARDGNTIRLKVPNPVTDELSDYERSVIAGIHATHAHLSFGDLKRRTHALPEYEDPKGSYLRIRPETILRESGWSDEDVREAQMTASEGVFFQAVAAGEL